MTLTWLLLILAIVLIALGALRWDMLVARWRELVGSPPRVVEPPPVLERLPGHPGLHPHAAPVPKPAFRRSGRRH